jgi:hypothetical protein
MHFEEAQSTLNKLAKSFEITIPENLKYLVYQHRLRIKVKTLPVLTESKDLGRLGRTPSFIPRKNRICT